MKGKELTVFSLFRKDNFVNNLIWTSNCQDWFHYIRQFVAEVIYLRSHFKGPSGIAQQLMACTALPEDLSLASNIQAGRLKSACNFPSQEMQHTLLAAGCVYITCTRELTPIHRHICTLVMKSKM